MNDIDKRAIKKYPITAENIDEALAKRKLYVKIATEQKVIDDEYISKITKAWMDKCNELVRLADKREKVLIDKACEWLLKNGFADEDTPDTFVCFKSGYIWDFRKAMEE